MWGWAAGKNICLVSSTTPTIQIATGGRDLLNGCRYEYALGFFVSATMVGSSIIVKIDSIWNVTLFQIALPTGEQVRSSILHDKD